MFCFERNYMSFDRKKITKYLEKTMVNRCCKCNSLEFEVVGYTQLRSSDDKYSIIDGYLECAMTSCSKCGYVSFFALSKIE